MDRRNFCKLTAIAALFGAAPAKMQAAAAAAPMRCRVSVVRRHCFQDLQSCYLDDPEAGACPLFSDAFSGEFNLAAASAPQSLCPKAWAALRDAAAKSFSCPGSRSDAAVLASCGDPTRPVVFKIERI